MRERRYVCAARATSGVEGGGAAGGGGVRIACSMACQKTAPRPAAVKARTVAEATGFFWLEWELSLELLLDSVELSLDSLELVAAFY